MQSLGFPLENRAFPINPPKPRNVHCDARECMETHAPPFPSRLTLSSIAYPPNVIDGAVWKWIPR
jgi:hypothetical protein